MSSTSGKMQQRAAILSILKKYLSSDPNTQLYLKSDIAAISEFENKDYTIRILTKELLNKNGFYCNICAVILLEISDNDTLQKYMVELLSDENIPDDKKIFMVSVLRQKGVSVTADEIDSYIKDSKETAQKGIKDFLNNALSDPEVQIDLLDFYQNIPRDEKIYLLENLMDEFSGDDLGNAFSLIAHLDVEDSELQHIIKGLLDTDSPYVFEGLNYILQNYPLEAKKRSAIRKKIKQINAQYGDFKNYGILKNSTIEKSLISFVDGKDYFSLVLARKFAKDSYDVFLAAVNITKGITSCIGFGNITSFNLDSIVKRLFSDSMPVEIPPEELKALFVKYKNLNKQTKTALPYENVVWEKLLFDIDDIETEDILQNFKSCLATTVLSHKKAKKFMSTKMLETWYYSFGQDKDADNLINKIEQNHATSVDEIDEIVSKEIDEVFMKNPEFISNLKDKLTLQAYIANLAGLKMSSACAYSFCYKNPYTKMLIESILDKSIYYYLSTRLAEFESEQGGDIFKNKIKTSYSFDEINALMKNLEEKWN